MKFRFLYPVILIAILIVMACSPQAPANATPTVNAIGTIAAQMASVMLTQTVAAYSPTPTATIIPTATDTPLPTKDETKKIITVVKQGAGCYHGPGTQYALTTHINAPKPVELLGIGSVSGWYVISSPYFYTPCWVAASDVKVDTDVDLTRFPVMTPGH
ncbi:MAG TPA: hypothetical protein VMT73_11065 [Anaerolineales bacterium]|nr:hypothetical protein [Anaerolineales bacterium]